MQVKFKQLHKSVGRPELKTTGAAAIDLQSTQTTWVVPGEQRIIPTGIAVEIPEGYVGLVCSRSGLAAKNKLFVLNAPGVIDSDFRGEIGVILFNAGERTFSIDAGDRIAQFMIVPAPKIEYVEVSDLSDTDRGTGGFGSTGV